MFFVHCDGGLANRIGSLVSGMCIAKILGIEYTVLWPQNNRCGAAYDDLFVPNCLALPQRLLDLLPYQDHVRIWLHENTYGFAEPVVNVRGVTTVEQLVSHYREAAGRHIIFGDNWMLPWLSPELVTLALGELRLRDEIVAAARAVMGGSAVGSFYGIHLRGTDFTSKPPTEQMLAVVEANPQQRFFLCSDEPTIEEQFRRFANVFFHDKSSYVEKIESGPWRTAVTDSDGRPYTSNINRTAHSVQQAAVDLLVLGASSSLPTSNSTFLSLSRILQSSGFISRHLG